MSSDTIIRFSSLGHVSAPLVATPRAIAIATPHAVAISVSLSLSVQGCLLLLP